MLQGKWFRDAVCVKDGSGNPFVKHEQKIAADSLTAALKNYEIKKTD